MNIEEMDDKTLLNEFADRFLVYDNLKDDEMRFLEDHPNRDMWELDTINEYHNLIIEIDNTFRRVREIIRFIKKDNNLLAC